MGRKRDDSVDTSGEDGSQGADTFFWIALGAALIGVAAALLAPDRSPGYALGAEGVYRLEIGAVFFFGSYMLGLAVLLAYQGRSFGEINLGNVLQANPPDPKQDENLSVAREAFESFEEQVNTSLKALEDASEAVEGRLIAVEDRLSDES